MASIEDFLSDDDAVDELSDLQVKDVFVRGQLMHQVFKALSGPPFGQTDKQDRIEEKLSTGGPGSLGEVIEEITDEDASLRDAVSTTTPEDNIENLHDELFDSTGDSHIEYLRDRIKTTLTGCGMPRINVTRRRVKYHTGEDTPSIYDPTSEDAIEEMNDKALTAGQAALGDF